MTILLIKLISVFLLFIRILLTSKFIIKLTSPQFFNKEYNNDAGLEIKFEDSRGYQYKKEYNSAGLLIKFEDSNKYWYKKEYNEIGLEIKFEDSNGNWYRKEYNKDNLEIDYEGSKGKRKIKLVIE